LNYLVARVVTERWGVVPPPPLPFSIYLPDLVHINYLFELWVTPQDPTGMPR